MAINKVVYGSRTLIDLSSDTLTAGKVATGYTAHSASGSSIVGTMDTIGEDGLTWNDVTSTTWGIVDRIPHTSQEKNVAPSTSQQIIQPDDGYDFLSKVTVSPINIQEKTVSPSVASQIIIPDSGYDFLSKVTVSPVIVQQKIVSPSAESQTITPDSGYNYLSSVTVNPVTDIVLTKTLTYSAKVTSTQTIWAPSDFGDFPYGSLADYESLSMTLTHTNTSHTTYQILFSNSFYPYFSYSTTNGYVHSGMMAYHGSSSSSVYNARSSTAINGSVAGYFQVTTSGIKLVCNSSYGLYGQYLFTLSAKLAS